MLSEPAIRLATKNRTAIMLGTMLLAVGVVCLYFLIGGPFARSFLIAQLGESNAQPFIVGLILPAFAIFLLPSIAAERYCRRYEITCPSCGANITRGTGELLSTRRCPSCEKQVLQGGKPRTREVYRRYLARRQRALLGIWFWSWPALGLLGLLVWAINRGLFADNPHVLCLAPLIGSIAGGWTWVRTRDTRYAPSMICSLVLLLATAALYMNGPL